MFPWFWWHLAPHIEYPLSGNVTQDFLMDAFFASIKPPAGDGRVEQQAFKSASYGKQLGLISEVLLSLADSKVVKDEKAKKSLQDLENIYIEIENIKKKQLGRRIEEATDLLKELKSSDPQQFKRLLGQLAEPRVVEKQAK